MDVHIDKRTLYESLEAAIGSQKLSARGVELLSVGQVRTAMGPGARGSSKTLIRNMQRKAVAEMKREELESVADWIVSRTATRFPNIAVVVKRGRVLQVYLNGKPAEVE